MGGAPMTFDGSALAFEDSRSWMEGIQLPQAPAASSTSARTYDRAVLLKTQEEALRRLFDERVSIWLEETKWQSSMSAITAHPMFAEIRGMKDDALRFALQRMRAGDIHLHWFPLLLDLAGDHDPVPPPRRGFIDDMVAAWLEWGEDEGKL
jgi:hypothetical protein